VLLEKDKLTAGTTWHSAGLLWRLRPSDTDIELLNYTRDLVRCFAQFFSMIEFSCWSLFDSTVVGSSGNMFLIGPFLTLQSW
jgi:hypothetical protein